VVILETGLRKRLVLRTLAVAVAVVRYEFIPPSQRPTQR
jgi:hypothetical protein